MLVLAQNGTTVVNLDYVARIDIISKGGGESELRALIVDAPDVILFSGKDKIVSEVFRMFLEDYDKSKKYKIGIIDFYHFLHCHHF